MTIRNRSSSLTTFSRDAWLEINLNAIEHNLKTIKQSIKPQTKIMAVVKSDAYGHGAATLAKLLEANGVIYFGVASVDEGVHLREAGVLSDVLILSPTPSWSFARAIENNLQLTISNKEQLNKLLQLQESLKQKISLQVKVNTGMNRNGAKWNTEAPKLIQNILSETNKLSLKGVFSHLANSYSDAFTATQLKRFTNLTEQFNKTDLGITHIEASQALHSEADNDFDMIRLGISLYGLGSASEKLTLKPALSLHARISQIQDIEEKESVGYGLTWTAQRKSKIGLLPLGYADGLKRGLSNKISCLYKGQLFPQVGTISMDQVSFDFTNCPEIKTGETVTLIGKSKEKSLGVGEWSKILNTIDYEIVCDLRARLPKIYTRK
ncbi:MAG TPA: alanine racemase [Vampirovibrionales bacterium]